MYYISIFSNKSKNYDKSDDNTQRRGAIVRRSSITPRSSINKPDCAQTRALEVGPRFRCCLGSAFVAFCCVIMA